MLVYGAADEYLNPGLVRHLAGLFSHAKLHLVDGASRWPRVDQPGTVARVLKEAS